MSENEIIALYCINKYAKQIRDDIRTGKKILKERLFETELFDDFHTKMPERFNLDISIERLDSDEKCGSTYDLEEMKRNLSKDLMESFVNDPELESPYDYVDENNFDGLIFYDCESYDNLIKELEKNLPEEYFDSIMYYSDIYRSDYKTIEKAIEKNDKLHEFLHYGFDKYENQKLYLYDLKSLTIKNSGLTPVSYHKMKGYNNILALYKIGDFTFHSVCDDDEIKNIEIEKLEELDMINSEIKLDNDKIIDLENAVKILCDYNGLSDAVCKKIIAGESYESDLLGFVFPDLDAKYNAYYNYYEDYYESDDY